jgi:hypothetical protein
MPPPSTYEGTPVYPSVAANKEFIPQWSANKLRLALDLQVPVAQQPVERLERRPNTLGTRPCARHVRQGEPAPLKQGFHGMEQGAFA